jgi:hypothetical protein
MAVDGSLLGSGTCKASLLLGGQYWRLEMRLLRRMSPLVHIASFRCDAEFGRYRGIAVIEQLTINQNL